MNVLPANVNISVLTVDIPATKIVSLFGKAVGSLSSQYYFSIATPNANQTNIVLNNGRSSEQTFSDIRVVIGVKN